MSTNIIPFPKAYRPKSPANNPYYEALVKEMMNMLREAHQQAVTNFAKNRIVDKVLISA